MTNANEYGFLPDNDAESNTKALQNAIDVGGEIVVHLPGIYDLSGTVEIGDDTSVIFEQGVQIRRQRCRAEKTGMLFLNKGCFSATYNRNIRIIGLHIDCNGVESDDNRENSSLIGLSAHVGMIYVENLVVEDFACVGLLAKDYAIQISAFQNIRLEHIYCEGDKDGVHLGWGRGFVIRHGKFCTFDDPIALNAFDYATSNPHVGWIEDGLIEDCTDLPAADTAGYFVRILGGAWGDWREGMQVQHSETVCFAGRVYRAALETNGQRLISHIPPSHSRLGQVEVHDGIHWVCVRDEAVYDCGCRNIVFRDLHLQKKRDRAMQIALNDDDWARSYRPGCHPIPQGHFTFERIYVEGEINHLLYSNYPSEAIAFKDTDLKDCDIYFAAERLDGLVYPTVDITVENVKGAKEQILAEDAHPISVTVL